jgi:hypothetical protein
MTTGKGSSLESTLIALALLQRIPRNHWVSTSELIDHLKESGFERNERSVQRYMNVLTDHFKLDFIQDSKPYRYRWPSNSRGFSIPMLDGHQSLLLTLAEHYLRNILPANLMKKMGGFFREARGNLTPYASAAAKQDREWLEKVSAQRRRTDDAGLLLNVKHLRAIVLAGVADDASRRDPHLRNPLRRGGLHAVVTF